MNDAAADQTPPMTVSVDSSMCFGHARCWQLAPDVFTLNDEGYCSIAPHTPVPPGQEKAVIRAVNACPERALTIHTS